MDRKRGIVPFTSAELIEVVLKNIKANQVQMRDEEVAAKSRNNQVIIFINTKKAFKKLYMFYFETFRIILNPSSVKK